MADEKWEIEWSSKYECGHKELDEYHEAIVKGISLLYKMCCDTKKFKDKISETTKQVERNLLEHMVLESKYLKKYDIPNSDAHIKNHDLYKEKIGFYKNYYISPPIRAILIADIVQEYMKVHFFEFDVVDIALIRQKLEN